MPIFFFQTLSDFTQYGQAAALLIFLFGFLAFVLRAMPTWERVKTKEIEVRTKEAEASGQTANALNQLGGVMNQLGTVMQTVTVETRKTTDNILILQRVQSNETENLSVSIDNLADRMDSIEGTIKENGIYVSSGPKAIASKRG